MYILFKTILTLEYFGADPTDLRPRFCNDHTIVTKLNSQLPDATLRINDTLLCNSRKITIDYSVYNTSTAIVLLTPIAIYANGLLIGTTKTLNTIPIDGEENSKITLDIPENSKNTFDLEFAVDDNGSRTGIITELNEANNTTILQNISLGFLQNNPVPDMESCNQGLGLELSIFKYEEVVKVNPEDSVSFIAHWKRRRLELKMEPILYNTFNFKADKLLNGAQH
jgi:hypothetical protein